MANELDDRAHKHTHTLAARGLKKNYGSRQVVKGVDLSVKSGEVVGLLGPNGAGKTTTFYMVVGLVVADGGDIELDGRSIARLPIYKRARLGVSYLPQEASVFRKLSVEDNIRAILEMQVDENGRALDTSEIEHRLEMLLDELQIKHLRTNAALSLSGGERRRTEIARALAANPRFILLDEPFAGVDPIAVIEIQRIVRFLRDRNIGVLITDHNVRETLAICDHAYIINEGRVLASGDPQDIINNYMIKAMGEVGQRFQDGKAFVPQLLMAGRAMKGALELLKPLLQGSASTTIGRVVIGTVKGDLHDIGKNLVASMLEGSGFEVINIGIDVPAEKFVQAVKDQHADILCMSALLTTTMTYMKDVIDAVSAAGIRDQVKIMVGGAPVNQAFADEIGADGYSDNANSAVTVAKRLLGVA